MPRKYPEVFPMELRDYVALLADPTTELRERVIPCPEGAAQARSLAAQFDDYVKVVRRTAELKDKDRAATYKAARDAIAQFRQHYQMFPLPDGLHFRPRSDNATARLIAPALMHSMAEADLARAERLGTPEPLPAQPEPPQPATGPDSTGSLYGDLLGPDDPGSQP